MSSSVVYSLARIVLCSCWFIPLPALSIGDAFQVTNVMKSIFMACWIDAGVRLFHLFLGFNSEEPCDVGSLVLDKIRTRPSQSLGIFFWYLNHFNELDHQGDLCVAYHGATIGFSGTLLAHANANLAVLPFLEQEDDSSCVKRVSWMAFLGCLEMP